MVLSCHSQYWVLLQLLHNCVTKGWGCPCPPLVSNVMEYVMLVMFCCSTRIGGLLGQLQIWLTAKLQNFKCQSSQRKIRNIQSESVSKTAGCFTTRSNCSFHTAALIRTSEILDLEFWIPYFLVCSCVQNIQKRLLHSESPFSNSCERVRGRHKSENHAAAGLSRSSKGPKNVL